VTSHYPRAFVIYPSECYAPQSPSKGTLGNQRLYFYHVCAFAGLLSRTVLVTG
jgi:hypothetical protein